MAKTKIYIDVGFYAGVAYCKHITDDSWTVYAFEPNEDVMVPDFVSRKAAWIEDGSVQLFTNERADAAYIDLTRGTQGQKTVEAIDFSKFVATLPNAYTICSMDIEGAEFKVLEKMLKEHTIDKIDLLDIEFHHRLMSDYTPEDAKRLIKRIQARGVKVELKEALE